MKRNNLLDVYAPDDGEVIVAFFSEDYGNCIYIAYPDDSASLQGHHECNYVKTGDKVKQGQLIAKMGDTGNGPLHWHLSYFEPGYESLTAKCTSNPISWLLRINFYPYNTKVSGTFQERYYRKDQTYYLHEGLDGGTTPIRGWKRGVNARKQYYYYCN